jgi:hypothetical protein
MLPDSEWFQTCQVLKTWQVSGDFLLFFGPFFVLAPQKELFLSAA